MTTTAAATAPTGPSVAEIVGAHGATTTSAAERAMPAALAAGWFPTVPDELTVAAGALDRLAAYEAAPRAHGSAAEVMRAVAADLLAGTPVDPAEVDEALAAAETRRAVEAVRFGSSTGLAQSIAQGQREALTEATPALLDGLRAPLAAVLAAARTAAATLAALDVTDPAAVAAATAPQRRALLDAAALAATYEQHRAAQVLALVAGLDVIPGQHGPHITGNPGWPELLAAGVHELSDAPLVGAIPSGSGVARLLAVAARDDVWLPTVAELRVAAAELAMDAEEIVERRAHAAKQRAKR